MMIYDAYRWWKCLLHQSTLTYQLTNFFVEQEFVTSIYFVCVCICVYTYVSCMIVKVRRQLV